MRKGRRDDNVVSFTATEEVITPVCDVIICRDKARGCGNDKSAITVTVLLPNLWRRKQASKLGTCSRVHFDPRG